MAEANTVRHHLARRIETGAQGRLMVGDGCLSGRVDADDPGQEVVGRAIQGRVVVPAVSPEREADGGRIGQGGLGRGASLGLVIHETDQVEECAFGHRFRDVDPAATAYDAGAVGESLAHGGGRHVVQAVEQDSTVKCPADEGQTLGSGSDTGKTIVTGGRVVQDGPLMIQRHRLRPPSAKGAGQPPGAAADIDDRPSGNVAHGRQ